MSKGIYNITKKQMDFLVEILSIGLDNVVSDDIMYNIYIKKPKDELKKNGNYFSPDFGILEQTIRKLIYDGEYTPGQRSFLNSIAMYYIEWKNLNKTKSKK